MENVRKQRTIELVPRERKRNYLVSKPNYHPAIIQIQMKETEIQMNKVYSVLSIQELSKILMYEFSSGYGKRKNNEKV